MAVAGGASAQAKPETLVKQRQAVMTLHGKYFYPIRAMAQGKVPYDGAIVARNPAHDPPTVSTYLLTKKAFRNFRLLVEGRLVTSEKHSGVALWGRRFAVDGEAWGYQGHLVMFPSGWGLYDLYRRNSIYRDDGRAKKAGKQHDWNKMEILAQGNRIRFVLNGQLISDWREPEPERIKEAPIGLQLHSNKEPQEVQWKGLELETFPEDKLLTVEE